ncbi:MAG: DUF371 domain-containing protein [Candidatus Lokiarchaeota archaeon]|nr:DUF371 domain-containing protein [Candidatus Lokiarchaeota archaeon]
MILSNEIFYVTGHSNVLGTHKTTLEFTKDESLTLKGDCILGIKATKTLPDFSLELKNLIRSGKKIILKLNIDEIEDQIEGWGHAKLLLSDKHSMVIRKSSFICPRTIMIRANKSACDINREIVNKLKKSNSRMKITIMIQDKNYAKD